MLHLDGYKFDKFLDERSNIIYRKFRTNKPSDELMNASLSIFARLNVMFQYEIDSTVDSKIFDWNKFTSGLSKKDNQKWLDDNFKDKYLALLTQESKGMN